jgi:shikimate dehydrogenase
MTAGGRAGGRPVGRPVGWPVGWPGATTQVAAVIGDPVEHSLSPVLHNAAFAALGLDWVYVALPVAVGQVGAAVAGMRSLGLAGLSVTMPHKAAVAAEMDELSPTATQLGVVNTVIRRGSVLVGDSTDGAGLLAALRADHGWQPDGRRCVVLGNGGAARAVIVALAGAGAAKVSVVARRPEAAAMAAALAGPAGEVTSIDAVGDADLIVNATSVGMTGSGPARDHDLPLHLDRSRLGGGQLVVDLIYAPPETPLLAAARLAGARVANGLGMLIHQAALQFRLWTGQDPPIEVMSAAAAIALGQGRHGSDARSR